jgi:hypothetical protein
MRRVYIRSCSSYVLDKKAFKITGNSSAFANALYTTSILRISIINGVLSDLVKRVVMTGHGYLLKTTSDMSRRECAGATRVTPYETRFQVTRKGRRAVSRSEISKRDINLSTRKYALIRAPYALCLSVQDCFAGSKVSSADLHIIESTLNVDLSLTRGGQRIN